MQCSFHLLALYGSAELSYNKQDRTGEFILLLSCLESFCDKCQNFVDHTMCVLRGCSIVSGICETWQAKRGARLQRFRGLSHPLPCRGSAAELQSRRRGLSRQRQKQLNIKNCWHCGLRSSVSTAVRVWQRSVPLVLQLLPRQRSQHRDSILAIAPVFSMCFVEGPNLVFLLVWQDWAKMILLRQNFI